MDEKYLEYINDSRMPCKYGTKCYQKNPLHHQKYKHPMGNRKASETDRHARKKFKKDSNLDTPKKIVVTDNSDDSNYSHDETIEESSNGNNSKNILTNNISDSDQDSDARVKITNDVSDSDEDSDADISENNEISSIDPQTSPSKKECKSPEKSDLDQLEENLDVFKTIDGSYVGEVGGYKDFINKKFLVDMPSNFFQFWTFCKKISRNPQDALKDIGLTLVGPFDVLAGKFLNSTKSDSEYLIHWRYFRDPPEFQTVLKGDDKSGYHIGYFRDSPDELPIVLCSNKSKVDGILTLMGGNLFAAVNFYLEDLKKTGDPFKKMHIGRLQTVVKKEASILGMDMSRKTNPIVAREKKIVTRSLNKIGLVVPFDKKTQVGYRELALDNKQLNTLLTKLQNAKSEEEKQKIISELQPVFTFANIAIDECDFGTGIELGWNLMAHGIDFLNSVIEDFLVKSYKLVNRETFAKITQAHMADRKKGCSLSVL